MKIQNLFKNTFSYVELPQNMKTLKRKKGFYGGVGYTIIPPNDNDGGNDVVDSSADVGGASE